MTQLYQLRSSGSWGIGDLTDLGDLATWSAQELGADFVLVNPLHAAEPVPPLTPSPYLPTTRRWANPLYLRVEEHPRARGADPPPTGRRSRRSPPRCAAPCATTCSSTATRRGRPSAPRSSSCAPCRCRRSGRRRSRGSVPRRARGCSSFATWCALAETYGPEVEAWPDGAARRRRTGRRRGRRRARGPRRPARVVAVAARGAAVRGPGRPRAPPGCGSASCTTSPSASIRTEPMRGRCATCSPSAARSARLPTRSTRSGRTGPSRPSIRSASPRPAMPPYRDLLRGVLRHAGGLRVDHVIGLFRTWWVPDGLPASAGTYVRYDHEALVGILALEAERAGAVVIGEDLGVVEPWVREHLDGARAARDLHLLVREGVVGRAAGAGALARGLPRDRHHPRPPTDRGLPARRAPGDPRAARACSPGRSRRSAPPTRRTGPPSWSRCGSPGCSARTPRPTTSSSRCTPSWPARPAGCSALALSGRGRRPSRDQPAGHRPGVPELAPAADRPGRSLRAARRPPSPGRSGRSPKGWRPC